MFKMALLTGGSFLRASMAPFFEQTRDRVARQTSFPACAIANLPLAESRRSSSSSSECPDALARRRPAARRSNYYNPGSVHGAGCVRLQAPELCCPLYNAKELLVGAHLLNRPAPAAQSASTTCAPLVRSNEVAP